MSLRRSYLLNDKHLAWYTGEEQDVIFGPRYCTTTNMFDYVKFGPYKKELGDLTCKSTNQRMWYNVWKDITYMFNGDNKK